ncbi:4-(cytidine 5'-diphospho)-2-C-methyl-D-erythritol kinase [Alkalibacillus almallahensis]|uniref:4-(cytidine 5'-diphospho)-2-C-methyl-D-erythritol kinase n=1 Tax=Alkalibacillus almallahensis TaxID=1379154 RepID=UPI0014219400
MMVFEKAPAKINLTLDVLHKRDDGYHEVEMIMTTVDLFDRLSFEKLDNDQIQIESENRFVPDNEQNLAYQAANIFKQQFSIKQGVRIEIDKQIPVAAGLAGGSSDAAATIRGLNRLFDTRLSNQEMEQLAERIGSDVPFCVQGGTQLARGRGEVLKPVTPLPPCYVVIAKPTVGVSTKEIYKRVNLNEMTHPDTLAMIHALDEQDFGKVCAELNNVLEPITVEMHSTIAQIKERMQKAGAPGVLMSGSGPTVYALVQQEAKADRIYNSLKGFCQEVYTVHALR